MSSRFPALRHPIVQAPLAGGPSTPELAGAVSDAGGLGFLAAGYLKADAVGQQIERLRGITSETFGLNLFCLAEQPVDQDRLKAYAERLAHDPSASTATLGQPRFEDDDFAAKLELAISEEVPVVSFTFGCPSEEVIARLHDSGASVWVTVTEPQEARVAVAAGADALVVQGSEAGGHRGGFGDAETPEDLSTLVLLRLIAAQSDLPLVAAGGIADGAGVAAVLCAGAVAAQVGTAFMLTPEAGTAAAHREALSTGGPTAVTRAFTGRRARGIVNRFMREHEPLAPSAYPQVHHLTAPLRRAARERGDAESINLWAGQAYSLARAEPAAEVVRRMAREARASLTRAQQRLAGENDS